MPGAERQRGGAPRADCAVWCSLCRFVAGGAHAPLAFGPTSAFIVLTLVLISSVGPCPGPTPLFCFVLFCKAHVDAEAKSLKGRLEENFIETLDRMYESPEAATAWINKQADAAGVRAQRFFA